MDCTSYLYNRDRDRERQSALRSPLSNKSNNSISATADYDIRDSSEAPPSIHDSIVDAIWIGESGSDCAKSPYQTAGPGPISPSSSLLLEPEPEPQPAAFEADKQRHSSISSIDLDIDNESPLSRLEFFGSGAGGTAETATFLYGHGTELAPIQEQRSMTTMRTAQTAAGNLSTSDLSSLMHDAPGSQKANHHRDSDHSRIDCLGRRHSSKSLDNLLPSSQSIFSKHKSQTPVAAPKEQKAPDTDRHPRLRSPPCARRPMIKHVVDEIHAYPRKPIYPPHQSPKTPPGIRRKFKRRSKAGGSDDSTSSATGGSIQIPRFRGPRSGHGNLSSHPFIRQLSNNTHHISATATTNNDTNTSTTDARADASRTTKATGGGGTERVVAGRERGATTAVDEHRPSTHGPGLGWHATITPGARPPSTQTRLARFHHGKLCVYACVHQDHLEPREPKLPCPSSSSNYTS